VLRALVTNDDGVDSPGLWALAAAAIDAGYDVVTAAPSWNSSGAAASLTAVESGGRLVMQPRTITALPGATVHAVEAAPAYIVRISMGGAFGPPPDIVLSGINAGLNIGTSVLHSGTVGAALTAATFGRRALAVSLDIGEPLHWETAADVARSILPWLAGAADATVVNVNVPNVPPGELRGLERGRLSFPGVVQTTLTELDGGHSTVAFGETGDAEPGTDAALLRDGIASITPLLAPCEASQLDTSGLIRRTTHA
jgi:5'-nucleotidase